MQASDFIKRLKDRKLELRLMQEQKEWSLWLVRGTVDTTTMVIQDYGANGFEVYLPASDSNRVADSVAAVAGRVGWLER